MAENGLIELTADIVSAHVSNNSVASAELPGLIQSIYAALSGIENPAPVEEAKAEPAVSIRSSVKNDYIVCLEDGKKLKMLKRYLRTNYGMSPEDYRAKWGLPRDYPMVAPAYAEQRRGLAKSIGLGRKKAVEVAAPVVKPAKAAVKKVATPKADVAEVTEPKKRGRPAGAAGVKAAKEAAQAHLTGAETAEA